MDRRDNSTMQTMLTLMLLLLLAARVSHPARILGIVPTASISHQLPFRLIALELVRRGHQVTFITTDPINEHVQNYTEIDVSFTYEYMKASFDFVSMSESSPIDMINMLPEMGKRVCDMQLSSKQMKDFLESKPTFDVIILERFMYHSYFGLVHQLGSPPLIGFLSLGAIAPILPAYGNPNNPAYSPDLYLGYSDRMSFWQRLCNAYVIARQRYTWYYQSMPLQEDLLRKHFGPDPPSVYETERNFSLLLVNNHFSMNYPRPMLPNIIELTGLHLQRERRPLPKDIQKFLDGAENGAIYFSLGTNVKGSAMPENKRRAFLEAFAQLPQRVLWKWETEDLPGRPDNVMISKWLPQQDVLAHPNVRLFITQGGLQSINEAAYFAVPLIGIPFIVDQPQNVVKMVEAGVGYLLKFKDVTSGSVLKAIRTVLEEKSYQENMNQFSEVYHEHQVTSLDRAIWWIEYVIRHKGAPHLRSTALDLHWWQLLLLDVVAFVVVMAAIVLYLLYKVVSYITKSKCLVQKHKIL